MMIKGRKVDDAVLLEAGRPCLVTAKLRIQKSRGYAHRLGVPMFGLTAGIA